MPLTYERALALARLWGPVGAKEIVDHDTGVLVKIGDEREAAIRVVGERSGARDPLHGPGLRLGRPRRGERKHSVLV